MYPDLSYIMNAIFGTAPDNAFAVVKTFGLFLVLAILASAFVLYLELKRKEKEGLLKATKEKFIEGEAASIYDIISNGIFGFILGFKGVYAAQHFADFKIDPASIVFSSLGNWTFGILGFVVFAAIRWYDKHRNKLDKPIEKQVTIHPWERIGDITMIAAISGVIGAKVFAVVEDLDALFKDPLGVLLSGGGVAIYGGLIFGFIFVYMYVKKKGLTPIHIMDAVAPALFVGYAVGRIGCQLAGDGDWGVVNNLPEPGWWIFPDWMWAFDYPRNVLNQGVPIEGCDFHYCRRLAEARFPTPFYETVVSFMLAGILWALRKRIKIAGILFFIYLIFNGMERFMIEKIRVNDKYETLGFNMTQAEMIAVGLILTGIIGVGVLWKRGKKVG
ncbi:MAG TPA: hypothetical protein ENK52_02600 [Saprospiraceae bacterium]|nr:hypothetical protein [Saprospiraceae bacterium]